MSGSHFSGIFCIVIKILVCKQTALVTYQSVGLHLCRIELYL